MICLTRPTLDAAYHLLSSLQQSANIGSNDVRYNLHNRITATKMVLLRTDAELSDKIKKINFQPPQPTDSEWGVVAMMDESLLRDLLDVAAATAIKLVNGSHLLDYRQALQNYAELLTEYTVLKTKFDAFKTNTFRIGTIATLLILGFAGATFVKLSESAPSLCIETSNATEALSPTNSSSP